MPITGSDTRMYAPRSESNLGYTKDPEDNPHGIGDPEVMEQERDKRQRQKEAEQHTTDLPHLQIEVPQQNPEPQMPPPISPEMPEDEPVMDDENENARGAEVSQMTGMPDLGNLSIGAATGTKPGAGGQLVNMGEPMEDAWSMLLKNDMDEEGDMDEDEKDLVQAATYVMDTGIPPSDLHPSALNVLMRAAQRFEGLVPQDYFSETLDAWDEKEGHPDWQGYESFEPLEEWVGPSDSEGKRGDPVLEAEARLDPDPAKPTWNEETGFTMSEPMEDAWSMLLKNDMDEDEKDLVQATTHILESGIPPSRLNRNAMAVLMHAVQRFQGLVPDAYFSQVLDNWDKHAGHPDWQGAIGEPIDNEDAAFQAEIRQTPSPYQPMWDEDTGFTMSEPMDDAWSSLMKSRLSAASKGHAQTPWSQPQFKIQPGGADITTANTRRAKLYSRHMQPQKHRGIDRAPLSVHRTHLGISTKQPLKLFPQKYGQQMGSMARRKWQGNIPSSVSGHAMGPETTYSPKPPKVAASGGLKIGAPSAPKLMGQTMGGPRPMMKSEDADAIKHDLSTVQKEMNYMHFTQMRRLMRKIKEALADKERRLKSEEIYDGHRDGETSEPQGATENLNAEDDPKNWGAPSRMFAAKGSGRVG